MDRDEWTERLAKDEKALGFSNGFKFVYGPWATLDTAKVAFLSLNPGRPPDNVDMRTVSDERGNSYEVERLITRSPITDQFLKLAEFLGHQPSDILTGVIAPFRSDDWDGMTREQKSRSLDLGREFWSIPLSRPELHLVISCSQEATNTVVKLTDASFEKEQPARWGNTRLRRYRANNNKVILHLPHLSRYRLLGREPSEQALRAILDGA